MEKTEKHVMAWVPYLWESANKYDTSADWTGVADAMYGAAQACNQADAFEDYAAYSFLASVARERRLDCLLIQLREAA